MSNENYDSQTGIHYHDKPKSANKSGGTKNSAHASPPSKGRGGKTSQGGSGQTSTQGHPAPSQGAK